MSVTIDEPRIQEILKKRVTELTEEDKEILRKWLLERRSKRSIAIDLRYSSKRVPAFVETWIRHEGKRYDIPEVDTRDAIPKLEKLGYRPRTRKKKKLKQTKPKPVSTAVKPETEEYEKLTEELRRYNPPYTYPPLSLREKAEKFIDKLLKKYGLDGYEVYEHVLSGRKFVKTEDDKSLYNFIIESWIRGWNPEEIIKELKPVAKSYKEYHKKIEEEIKTRAVINRYASSIMEWINKYGKKSGLKLLGSTVYSDGAVELKLEKYSPETGAVEYYTIVHIKPTMINGEKKILMDIMFSKDKDRFIGEQSIQYIYTPEELEKEDINKIITGTYLGDYFILHNLKQGNLDVLTNPEEALEHLRKNHVFITKELEAMVKERIKEWEKPKTVDEKLNEIMDVDTFKKYFPEVLEYIRRGYKYLEKNLNTLLPELVRQAISESYGKYKKYYNIDEDTRRTLDYIMEKSRETGEDPIKVAYFWVPHLYIVPLLYFLGKGYRDTKSLRKLGKEYAEKVDKMLKNPYNGDIIKRILRSTRVLTKAVPMMFNMELLNTSVGRKVLSNIDEYDVHEILNKLYKEERNIHGKFEGYMPKQYHELMRYLIDKYDNIISKEKAQKDINYVRELLKEYLNGRLRYGDIRFDVIEEDGKQYIVMYDGNKEIAREEIRYSESPHIHALGEISSAFHGLAKHAKEKGYGIYYQTTETPQRIPYINNMLIAKMTDMGFDVLYPEHRLYEWSNDEFIKNYLKYSDAIHDFKESASKHGVEYPMDLYGAVKTVFENEKPYIKILESYNDKGEKEYVLLYKGKDTWGNYGEKSITAPTLDDLLRDALTKLTPRQIKVLAKHFNMGELGNDLLKIMNAINITLAPTEIGNEKLYLSEDRTLAISPKPIKELPATHHYGKDEVNKVKFYLTTDLYLVGEPNKVKKELDKYNIKYEINNDEVKVYIDKNTSYTRLKKILKLHGSPHGVAITVETPDGIKNTYRHLLPVLTRLGKPEEIWIGEKAPIMMKYGNWYIAVSPAF